jgi:hypothetical protein
MDSVGLGFWWWLCSFHTRNNRNESTVRSTQGRIFWYSIFEALAVCVMSLYVRIFHTSRFMGSPSLLSRMCELMLLPLFRQPSSVHPQDFLLPYGEPVSRLSRFSISNASTQISYVLSIERRCMPQEQWRQRSAIIAQQILFLPSASSHAGRNPAF